MRDDEAIARMEAEARDYLDELGGKLLKLETLYPLEAA